MMNSRKLYCTVILCLILISCNGSRHDKIEDAYGNSCDTLRVEMNEDAEWDRMIREFDSLGALQPIESLRMMQVFSLEEHLARYAQDSTSRDSIVCDSIDKDIEQLMNAVVKARQEAPPRVITRKGWKRIKKRTRITPGIEWLVN